MKKLTFMAGLGLSLAIAISLYSCKKQKLSTPDTNNPLAGIQTGGVQQESTSKLNALPLMVSDAFLERQLDNLNGQSTNFGQARRDRTLPVVSILSPANNATVSGTVTISVSASDNVGVAAVSVFIDGVLLSTKNLAPYSFAWVTTGVSSGTHVIKATASDAAGNVSSYSIQVGISTISNGDIAPPSVTITSPVSGSSVNAGNSLTIDASATDNVGVASVSFAVDGVFVSVDQASPYNYVWNTTGFAIGLHTISATAKDAAGNSAGNSIIVTINTTVISTTVLPSNVSLLMPPVQNQGGEGSCVIFATTYAARSAEKYYQSGASSYDYSINIFSPEFVYDQIKTSDCASGTGITTALDFLKSTGACSWQSMPYSSYNGCSLIPTASQLTEAGGNKILSYSRLISSDSIAIKNMLVAHHPVIISIGPDQSFVNAQPGFIWRTLGAQTADHSLVICGYDDSKNAYKVMNSWGTGWGDAGYSWIDYSLFPQASFYYSYVIQ